MPSKSPRWTRRRMLRLGFAFGGASILASSGIGYGLLSLGTAAKERNVLSETECNFIKAFSDTYFPPQHFLGKHLDEFEIDAKVDHHLAQLFPSEQRAARSLLNVFNHWPRLSFQSTQTFAQLPFLQRTQVLQHWENSSYEERRGIVSLLRIFIGMHVFEHPPVIAALGAKVGCSVQPQTSVIQEKTLP